MKSEKTNSFDPVIEKIFGEKVTCSNDFTKRTIERISMEDQQQVDLKIDEILKYYPIETSTGFSEKTLRLIRLENNYNKKIIPLFKNLVGLTAIAAAIVFAFISVKKINEPILTEKFSASNKYNSLNSIPTIQVRNKYVVAQNNVDDVNKLPVMTDIFLMAEGLLDAQILLQDENIGTLAIVTD